MTEQTQLSVATNYEKHIYIYVQRPLNNTTKCLSQAHSSQQKTEAVHLCPTLCCVIQATPTPTYTKHNKTKQLLSLVEIFMHFVLSSTREKITKLL
jgi:hypothetical protein